MNDPSRPKLDRLFLDANVLFSAAYRSDAGVRRLWDLRSVALVTSAYTAEEARRNLTEPHQRKDLEELLGRMEVIDQPPIDPGLADLELPDKDIPVIAAVMASGTTHLITGDRRHFGRFFGGESAGVMVLRPADYLGAALAERA